MHVLIGAVVGAAFALVTVAGAAVITGRRPTLKNALLAVAGGAVAGAVTSATLGASSLVGVSAGRQVVSFAAGGAVGGAFEQVGDNVVEGRELHEGVAEATALGAGAGLFSLGTMRGSSAVLGRVAPRLVATSSTGRPSLGTRLLTAPVPGTGGGILRTWREGQEEEESPTVDHLAPVADVAAVPADVDRERDQRPGAPPRPPSRGMADLLGGR